MAIHPFRVLSKVTPKDFNIPYENISFRTKDDVLIKGWFIPSTNPKAKTIILLHGYPADKGDILPSRIFLHAQYNLLFFDFRYLGESEGKMSTIGKFEVLDLLAAIDYLHTRGINEVGVWGLSMGGAVALMGASESKSIKAVVAESPYARLDWMAYEYYRIPLLRYPLGILTRWWGRLFLGYDIKDVAPVHSVEKLSIPILIISSKHDQVISFKHGQLLKETLKNNKQAEVIFIENFPHGQLMENYQTIISEFFAKNLR